MLLALLATRIIQVVANYKTDYISSKEWYTFSFKTFSPSLFWHTARILTSDSEVQNFLKKFPNLKVVSLKENVHSKPGGVLFNKFKKAMMSLPQSQRQTCLAFHGTSGSNIDSILTNGYDPKKRSGQAYGSGEYFAVTPNIPLGYCKGGKKMLLNELLLGQQGTHHTKHGDIIVMKNPPHDLPRYTITFQWPTMCVSVCVWQSLYTACAGVYFACLYTIVFKFTFYNNYNNKI